MRASSHRPVTAPPSTRDRGGFLCQWCFVVCFSLTFATTISLVALEGTAGASAAPCPPPPAFVSFPNPAPRWRNSVQDRLLRVQEELPRGARKTRSGTNGTTTKRSTTAIASSHPGNQPRDGDVGSSNGSSSNGSDGGEDGNKNNDDLFKRRNQQWVVLVDDEESIRFAVGDFLYDRGYEVTACADAGSLLDLIALRNKQGRKSESSRGSEAGTPRLPDVIVSDVRMPESDKNGYELVEFLRSAGESSPSSGTDLGTNAFLAPLKTVPIVLLTAKAMTDDRIRGYQAGADVVVPKPFAPEELVSILDNLIRRRQQRLKPTAAALPGGHAPGGSSAHPDDLRALQREVETIKALVAQNAAATVRMTDVVLTERERKAIRLLSEGSTPREMARAIWPGRGEEAGGSESGGEGTTAAVHRLIKSLCERTETESKTELVRWARAVGYLP